MQISPARRRALILESRREALGLLARTPAAHVLDVQDEYVLPEPLDTHWQAFIRIADHPGDPLPPSADEDTRRRWIAEPFQGRAFPRQIKLYLPPTALLLEVTGVEWLSQLYEELRVFDVILLEGENDMVAFSDDEHALWRLIVRHGAIR